MLRYVDEIIFWCVAGEEGEQIIELIKNVVFRRNGATGSTGFYFRSTYNKPQMDNPKIQDIVYALKLSEAASKSWSSKETLSVANKIAEHIDVDKDEIIGELQDNAKKTAEVAQLFGASSIIQFLPIDKESVSDKSDEPSFDANCPISDPLLQLNILRDLSGILLDKPDFNLVLEIVLEGIYRGVGLDRTVFAMLTSDKKAIKAKYVLGKNNQEFINKFHFSLQSHNIFSRIINNPEPIMDS